MNPQNPHAHEDRLLDFAYGELPVPEARVVEAHVQGCARCTQALADIRGVRATMSQLSVEPAPDAGLESLMAYAQQAARRAAAGPAPRPSRWRRWFLPVVGLASVGTFGILALQAMSPELMRPSLREAAMVQEKKATESSREAPAPAAADVPVELKMPVPSPAPQQDSAPGDAEFGQGTVVAAQPPRADNWKDSGSGGGLDARLVPGSELKAKRESPRLGTERARSGPSKSAMKPAPVAKSSPAEKADRDEADLSEAQGSKLAYARDSLRLGGAARAEETTADDETADGLSVREEEESLAVATGSAAAPAPPSYVAAPEPAPEAVAPAERRAPTRPSKKGKWSEPMPASAAPAMPPPPPAQAAAPKAAPSVSELSRQALEAYRAGAREQEAALLRSAINAGATGQERLDLLNRLCDAELSLGRQAAGKLACTQVMTEAPDSSAAQTARRRLAKAAEPSK